MPWDDKIEKAQKIVDLLLKCEVHALLLVGVGALMCLHGNQAEGQLVIGAGLAVFRGNN